MNIDDFPFTEVYNEVKAEGGNTDNLLIRKVFDMHGTNEDTIKILKTYHNMGLLSEEEIKSNWVMTFSDYLASKK